MEDTISKYNIVIDYSKGILLYNSFTDNMLPLSFKEYSVLEFLLENLKYFDDELYKNRNAIERANAWVDAFKALLIRYERLIVTWMSLQWLALCTLFCRKLKV